MQIVIGNTTEKNGYFEVAYTFILDVPQASQTALTKQQTALSSIASGTIAQPAASLTQTVTGVATYSDGTALADVQIDLVNKLNSAQMALNNDTSTQWAGSTFDGTNWS